MIRTRPKVGEIAFGGRIVPDLDLIEQKWIPALESGEYKQIHSTLSAESKDGGFGFCCLGVLCDVLGATWSEYGPASRSILMPGMDAPQICHTLPFAVSKQHGFIGGGALALPPSVGIFEIAPEADHHVYADNTATSISLDGMNDRGITFQEIADALKRLVAAWRSHLDETYPLPATTTENTA